MVNGKSFPLALLLLTATLLGCTIPRLVPQPSTPAEQSVEPPLGEVRIAFSADSTSLQPGECATLRWSVEGGFGVQLNGQEVERSDQMRVCPHETTTYFLSVDTGETVQRREVVIVVGGAEPLPSPPAPQIPLGTPGTEFGPTTLQPFTAGVPYQGYETGLYPGATNEMPEEHRLAGERIAATIRPLDSNGQPDDQQGRVLALAFGHSNAYSYFEALATYLAERSAELNPRFELLNAAVGGNQLPEIVQLEGAVWDTAQRLITQEGYSSLQVQVLFLHTTYHGATNFEGNPPGAFPEKMQQMQQDLATVLEHAVRLYPNLKVAYLTCDGFRQYTGFEPHVWQEAFAFKWLIESQIGGEPGTAYEGADRRLPWLTWGPYIWDNTWDESYFEDGVHPTVEARAIVTQKWWDYLSSDSVARIWLFRS